MKQLSQVEIGKMRQLADFLETIEPSKFVLSDWVVQEFTPAKTMLFGLVEIEPECGFAGCAMGWAAHSKLFNGLRLDDHGLIYKGHLDWKAVAKLFGFPIGNTSVGYFLFTDNAYKEDLVTPGMVADRLNKFADKVESRLKRAMYAESNPFAREPLRLVASQ